MEALRDTAFEMCDGILEGRFGSPGHREFQVLMSDVPDEHHEAIRKLVRYCVDGGINDFMACLEKDGPQIPALAETGLVGGGDEGLLSRLHGPDGWKARFSKFPWQTAKARD